MNIVTLKIYNVPYFFIFTRNDENMLGVHLVLVTLHMRFAISIEQRQIEMVTLNTSFTVVT